MWGASWRTGPAFPPACAAAPQRARASLSFGSNFCQTRLDDWGGLSIQNVWYWLAPFSGTFAPASPLSAFNGERMAGTWVLNVSDDVYSYTGNVRAFSIETTGFDCSPAPPPYDGGTPPPYDAGTLPSDAGTLPSDAGTPPPFDAGTPAPDGGSLPRPDGG